MPKPDLASAPPVAAPGRLGDAPKYVDVDQIWGWPAASTGRSDEAFHEAEGDVDRTAGVV